MASNTNTNTATTTTTTTTTQVGVDDGSSNTIAVQPPSSLSGYAAFGPISRGFIAAQLASYDAQLYAADAIAAAAAASASAEAIGKKITSVVGITTHLEFDMNDIIAAAFDPVTGTPLDQTRFVSALHAAILQKHTILIPLT